MCALPSNTAALFLMVKVPVDFPPITGSFCSFQVCVVSFAPSKVMIGIVSAAEAEAAAARMRVEVRMLPGWGGVSQDRLCARM